MSDFIVKHQFPDPATALKRAQASLEEQSQNERTRLNTPCIHMLPYLPNDIDLVFFKKETMVKTIRGNGESTFKSSLKSSPTAASPSSSSSPSTKKGSSSTNPSKFSSESKSAASPSTAVSASAGGLIGGANSSTTANVDQSSEQPQPSPLQKQQPQKQQQIVTTWMLKNPIHALHLASQLDSQFQCKTTVSSADAAVNSQYSASEGEQPPILYGEEQERLLALQTPGLQEFWHSYLLNQTQLAEYDQHYFYGDHATPTAETGGVGSHGNSSHMHNNKPHSGTGSASFLHRQQHHYPSSSSSKKHTSVKADSVGSSNSGGATGITRPSLDRVPSTASAIAGGPPKPPSSSSIIPDKSSSSSALFHNSGKNKQGDTHGSNRPPPGGAISSLITPHNYPHPQHHSTSASNHHHHHHHHHNHHPDPTLHGSFTVLEDQLPERRYWFLRSQEDQIRVLQSLVLSSNSRSAGTNNPLFGTPSLSSPTLRQGTPGGNSDVAGANSAPGAKDGVNNTQQQQNTTPQPSSSSISSIKPNSMNAPNSKGGSSKKRKAEAAAAAAAAASGEIKKGSVSSAVSFTNANTTGANANPKSPLSSQPQQQSSPLSSAAAAGFIPGGGGGRTSLFSLGAWKRYGLFHHSLSSADAEKLADSKRRKDQVDVAEKQINKWITHYGESRQDYWREQTQRAIRNAYESAKFANGNSRSDSFVFGTIAQTEDDTYGGLNEDGRYCKLCCKVNEKEKRRQGYTQHNLNKRRRHEATMAKPRGDDLMQCLDCGYVGCAARVVSDDDLDDDLEDYHDNFGSEENGEKGRRFRPHLTREHIQRHMLLEDHTLAVTCGPKAQVYCFKCGEYIRHQIFEQEKERIDLIHVFPWMGWKKHPIQRSFDAFRFIRVDQSIFWRGMTAIYPPFVPPHHIEAARSNRWRHMLFHGKIQDVPEHASRAAKGFALRQSQTAASDRYTVIAPVGMYNLGNTCYMTAILHCLLHCPPMQKYFLREVGHNYLACALYRQEMLPVDKAHKLSSPPSVCLGCEVDKVFLSSFGNAHGQNMVTLLSANPFGPANALVTPETMAKMNQTEESGVPAKVLKGEPLITTDMLTAAWKCKDMSHLAGYEQRDAHEFLHAFLDVLGKHIKNYRIRIQQTINISRPNSAYVPNVDGMGGDIIKKLFEGKLRSVLICQKCRNKRVQSESFVSISLPLSKDVQKATANPSHSPGRTRSGKEPMTIERCLHHFTLPEALSDPVDCPSCREKTQTTKQHVVSRLPPVLCLHLKRFDAALNKKIEDFVAYPATQLNMGPYLPHWCEETTAAEEPPPENAAPSILYDLVGTVNHFGTLQSGHYVANVKVDSKWYHCNDAHVSNAGPDDGESEVVNSDGAYLLFYVRAQPDVR